MTEILDTFVSFFTAAFVDLILRFLFFAGGAFLIFYVGLSRFLHNRKIQAAFPKASQYVREFGYSILTTVVFAVIGWLAMGKYARPFTQWYFHIEDFGWTYFFLSVVLMILIHDAYFYWTHRLMHVNPKVYRLFHKVHHDSVNPSPWAAFSFHPLEAVVEAGILVVFALVLPVHPLALMLFLVWMTFFNVYGHLGYELFPKWVTRNRILKYWNTTTNHNLHHKYYLGNYAIYFTWWDVWMGTTHPAYDDELKALQAEKFVIPETRADWNAGLRKIWMITPYIAMVIGLFVFKNAWVTLLGFHGFLLAALVIHRSHWNWDRLWSGGRALAFTAITISILGFIWWLNQVAMGYSGYGDYLSRKLAAIGLSGNGMLVFAIYFCLINPTLEEAFWRGLFGSKKRRPVLADFAYGLFHFLILAPMMDYYHALIAAFSLVLMGYLWRQISCRENGLAIPVVWHSLGDVAIVMVVAGLVSGA